MASIVTLSGSPSSPSRSQAIAHYAAAYLGARGHTVSAINVRDLDPAELIGGQYNGATVQAAAAQIAGTQAMIVITPVYKAAYTGVLKTLLDLLPAGALAGKTTLPIAVGGSLAHSLVIDYALKPVLNALGAAPLLAGIYLIDRQIEHTDGRDLRFVDADAESRLHSALDGLAASIA